MDYRLENYKDWQINIGETKYRHGLRALFLYNRKVQSSYYIKIRDVGDDSSIGNNRRKCYNEIIEELKDVDFK